MATLKGLKFTNSSPTPMVTAKARAIATADRPEGDSDDGDVARDTDSGGRCKPDGGFSRRC